MSTPRVRVWRPGWPCPVAQTLRIVRRGGADPTYRATADGAIWRGIRTPEGPATLRVLPRPDTGDVLGEAWGSGATWALEQMPAMLGADDDPSGFEPRHPVLERGLAAALALAPRPHRPRDGGAGRRRSSSRR